MIKWFLVLFWLLWEGISLLNLWECILGNEEGWSNDIDVILKGVVNQWLFMYNYDYKGGGRSELGEKKLIT